MSDHLPIFAYFSSGSVSYKKEVKFYKRDYSEQNLTKFRTSLSQVDWTSVVMGQDPNKSFDSFSTEYNKHFEDCFPLMISKNSSRKPKMPWITKGLLVSVRKKNKLYKKYMGNPTLQRELHYKRYKNKLNHLIRNAKKTYYDNKFDRAKGDLKETWRLINEVINTKLSKQSSLPSSFKSNGISITDPFEIANGFCRYFTNIGSSLANRILPTNCVFQDFLGPNISETIFLKPTTERELKIILMSFKGGKAPGHDHIPMHLVKNSFDIISKPLMHLINLSLEKGIFPNNLKTAKIIPIFKAGDVDIFTNYRPISILSSFSKIYEKIMYNRLLDFIERFEILYSLQFGFRTKHSTNHALTHLINKIATDIDQNKISIGVFLDLSKAFDTLNRDILFSKLENYGIRGVALNWIKSYFQNRKQYVQYHNVTSSHLITQCGVPQGSILGPLFFILYINDLPNASRVVEPLLFADDTSICYSHTDPEVLAAVLNEALLNIGSWMRANKLSLNIDKTDYVIFHSRHKKSSYDISLLLDNKCITRKTRVKFLGVFLDENLTWKPHINHVCKKISKSIGIIYRARFYLLASTKLSMYYTLIYPYLSYCNTAWSSTYVSNLSCIFLLQKRIVRVLTNSNYRAHTAPLFSKLKILSIYQLNSFHIGKFMYSYHNQLLPPSFRNLFTTNIEIHEYNTRNASSYRAHACRTNIKQFTILFQGPKLWNSLPEFVRGAQTINCFRNRILKYLLNL